MESFSFRIVTSSIDKWRIVTFSTDLLLMDDYAIPSLFLELIAN